MRPSESRASGTCRLLGLLDMSCWRDWSSALWWGLFHRIASLVLRGSGPEDRYSAARGQRTDTPLSLIGESLSSVHSSAIPKLGPLLRTLTRYSECGQPRPRAEQTAHVRNRGLACEHSMTPWPPRPRHEEAGTNALISLSVMPISMSSKTQVRRVALVKSFVEEDEPSAVLMM